MQIQAMTDEQRKALVLEYFKRVDQGDDILGMFDERAELYFPKWGIARGRDQTQRS